MPNRAGEVIRIQEGTWSEFYDYEWRNHILTAEGETDEIFKREFPTILSLGRISIF